MDCWDRGCQVDVTISSKSAFEFSAERRVLICISPREKRGGKPFMVKTCQHRSYKSLIFFRYKRGMYFLRRLQKNFLQRNSPHPKTGKGS